MPQEVSDLLEVVLSERVLVPLGISSVMLFVLSLITIPVILVRLPVNYFDESYPRSWFRNHHPALRVFLHVMKNTVGVVLLLAGIAMLVLPGQGILSILIGISLLEFPGKKRLEVKLIGQPKVLHAINVLREKFGKLPLTLAPTGDANEPSKGGHKPTAAAD